MMVVNRFLLVCDAVLSSWIEIGPHVLSRYNTAGHGRRIVVVAVMFFRSLGSTKMNLTTLLTKKTKIK